MKQQTILMLALCLLLSSCATMFTGTKTSVYVKNGTPERAKIFYNGSYVGEAPAKVYIPKKAFGKFTEIEVRADNYKTTKIRIDRRVQEGSILLDVLFTGLIGLAVDFSDGAIYRPFPDKVDYYLDKK